MSPSPERHILLAGVDQEHQTYIDSMMEPLTAIYGKPIPVEICTIEQLNAAIEAQREQLLGLAVFTQNLVTGKQKKLSPAAGKAFSEAREDGINTALIHNEVVSTEDDNTLKRIITALRNAGVFTHGPSRNTSTGLPEIAEFSRDWHSMSVRDLAQSSQASYRLAFPMRTNKLHVRAGAPFHLQRDTRVYSPRSFGGLPSPSQRELSRRTHEKPQKAYYYMRFGEQGSDLRISTNESFPETDRIAIQRRIKDGAPIRADHSRDLPHDLFYKGQA
jgi:hypothetical protein